MIEKLIEGSLLAQAHAAVAEVVQPGNTVVDATLGNGHDTLFLARLVGNTGQVIGFDIQAAAIESTAKRLQDAAISDCVCQLQQCSHAELKAYADPGLRAVMFNLGYLPGGDKTKITQIDSTLSALTASLELLAADGVLSVICYPGHAGGDDEADAVLRWFTEASRKEHEVVVYRRHGAKETTPFLMTLHKQG